MRDPVSDVTCLEVAYDQVEAQIIAQLAAQSSTNTDTTISTSPTASAADSTNNASIDELLTSILGNEPNPSSSGSYNADRSCSLDGLDTNIDAEAWLGRFKGLSEAEALQELQVLKYLGGQAGVLRPRGHNALGFRGFGDAVTAVAGSKRRKRTTKLGARRG